MSKEDIPFEILEILDPIIKNQKKNVDFSYNLTNQNEIHIKSNLFGEKFYFKINYKPATSVTTTEGTKNNYIISYYPQSENIMKVVGTNRTAKGINKDLNDWFKVVDKYENTKTFLDDPIIETYKKDIYENTLKFLPEPDDENPYPLQSQINFIEYLDNLEEIVKEEIKSTKDVENKENLKYSLNIISEIKTKINKLSKGEIKSKFSLSLAYIAKSSIKFFNTITKEIIKEIAVKAIMNQ